MPLNFILQGGVDSESDFRTFKPEVFAPDAFSYSNQSWNVNVFVLRQNALLTACVALECIMGIMSLCGESYPVHALTRMHTLLSCEETLVSAASHSTAQVWNLGNNDMAAYMQDKCMNTITSWLATRMDKPHGYRFFLPPWVLLFPKPFCLSALCGVDLMFSQAASKGDPVF